MESEEAILENDNNFNVELESTLRNRDPQQAGPELLDNAGCDTFNSQDASPARDMQDENDIVMTDDTWKMAMHDIQDGCDGLMSGAAPDTFGLSRPSTEELMVEAERFKNERAAGTSTRLPESREEILDYEDFIGNEDISQHEEAAELKIPENVGSVGKEFQEPMEVDSYSLDDADTPPATDINRQAGGVELVHENIATSVQHLQPGDEEIDREQCKNNTIESEASKEADPFETDQSGSSRDVLSVFADGYEDSLEENLGSSASGHAVTGEVALLVDMPAVPLFIQQESGHKDAKSSVDNEEVANEEGFSIEDKAVDDMGLDSKGDGEDVGSPYPDKGDNAAVLGSPHQDEGDNAEGIDSPHQDKEDDPEDVGSPQQDMGDNAGVMGSLHQNEGDGTEDIGSPQQDKGGETKSIVSPHQDTGDSAEDLDSPHQDTGENSEDMGSPHDKDNNVEFMNSFNEDRNEDYAKISVPSQDRNEDCAKVSVPSQDRNYDLTRVDAPFQYGGLDLAYSNSSVQDKKEELLCVDSSHQDKEDGAEEVDSSHQDKEDSGEKVDFSFQDKEDDEKVDFSHHDKGAVIRVDRDDAVTDMNPGDQDRGSDVEEIGGAVLHHRSNLSAEKCTIGSSVTDNVVDDTNASSDKKLVDAGSSKDEFGGALEGEHVTREASSEASGCSKGDIRSYSPGSRDVEADNVMDDAETSGDMTLPRSSVSDECQNQEGTHVDGVTDAETQDEIFDSERTSNSETVSDRTSSSKTAGDRASHSETVADRTSSSETVGERTSNPEIVGDSTSNSEKVGDRTNNSETVGDRTSNSETVGDSTSNSETVGDSTSNSETVGDSTSNSETVGDRTSNSETVGETLVSITSTKSRQILSSESDNDTVIDASLHDDMEETMDVSTEVLDTEPRRLQSGDKTVLSEIPDQHQDLCDTKEDTDPSYGEQSTGELSNTSRYSNRTAELMDMDESTIDSSDAAPGLGVETNSSPVAVDSSVGKSSKGKGRVTRNTGATSDSIVSPLTQDTSSTIIPTDTSPTHLVPDTNLTPLLPDISAKLKKSVDPIPKAESDSSKTESDSSKTESDSGKPEAGCGKSVKKEAPQKSVVQPKAEQAPAVTSKRPQRARRTGSKVESKAASTSIKKETSETKFNENGLTVKHSAASSEGQLLDDEDKGMVMLASSESKRTESRRSKSSRTQTCLVCQKICKCKYNIVRNGDVKHLCDDPCFKQFQTTPSTFLKGPDNSKPSKRSAKAAETPPPVPAEVPVVVDPPEMEPRPNATYKTCAVCQLLNLNASQPFCNWKGLDFCGESCLGKFQANLNSVCSFCHAVISVDLRPECCVKIGADMHLFCKPRCCNEFKKKLRLCSFCQRDVSGILGAFTGMVGKAGKLKEFCSQVCMRKLESRMKEFDLLVVEKGGSVTCSNCRKNKPLKYNVWLKGKPSTLCSDTCFSVFKYTNNISTDACDNCGTVCSSEEAQTHFVQYAGQLKQFCSDACVSHFCKAKSRIESCSKCGVKKMNFDMIERQDAENKFMIFCSLDCLALCHVELQTKTGQPVACDQCKKVAPAQYHLTMSDASIRNYCTYSCVLMATNRTSPVVGSTPLAAPATNRQPQTPVTQQQKVAPLGSNQGRGRAQINTRQATARQQSESVPVISKVVSLASPGEQHQRQTGLKSTPNPPQPVPPQPATQKAAPSHPSPSPASSHVPSGTTRAETNNLVPSADGKHQILIQSPPPKVGKNKSVQCKPVTQTKATSCKPHSQTKETQTEELLPKTVYVPIPVPVYVPMPTVMFTAPAPIFIPFPVPIPVPIFIPTTRKSVSGVFKTIQDILERIPTDPLEAELLMMAEAVAADKRPGDSETDSESDTITEDFSVPGVEEDVKMPAAREDDALLLKRERQGEEDMIQMALRMAEEMSGPIEDLETSVEPVAVSSEAPQQHLTMQSYEIKTDDDYIPPRSVQHRGTKRASRGRTPVSRSKKARMAPQYDDDTSMQSHIQSMEPPPDANFRLKFTYGVNAWRHWVANKNTEIEKAKQTSGNYKLRNFPSDLLKCTTEDLNNTLCMFIREVRKPNGDEYSPDSIYYLCLGIQQYLFENGRIENIFTDMYFERFTNCLNENIKTLRPKINSQGQMLCRIEEEHLWESKQLGAHSPFILLNTLIYFHTKHFILKTAQEHMALSFAQILKHWKKGVQLKGHSAASGKNVSLRFYCLANGKKDGLAARKNKDGLPVYEVTENFDNPLRCPVKLYEFFLSKCPESIKNRNDIFYPVPERSCVPDSPVWYSTQSIDVHTMDKMLTRVLLVREIQEAHLHAQPIYM